MATVDMYIFHNMSIHYFNIEGIMDCVKIIGLCEGSLLKREGGDYLRHHSIRRRGKSEFPRKSNARTLFNRMC